MLIKTLYLEFLGHRLTLSLLSPCDTCLHVPGARPRPMEMNGERGRERVDLRSGGGVG